jgi:hypothetical protein
LVVLSGEGKGSTFTLVSHFLKNQYNQWFTVGMSLMGVTGSKKPVLNQ